MVFILKIQTNVYLVTQQLLTVKNVFLFRIIVLLVRLITLFLDLAVFLIVTRNALSAISLLYFLNVLYAKKVTLRLEMQAINLIARNADHLVDNALQIKRNVYLVLITILWIISVAKSLVTLHV